MIERCKVWSRYKDGPRDSTRGCPEIGRLTSRLASTITLNFVTGYSYEGVGHDEHMVAGGLDTD